VGRSHFRWSLGLFESHDERGYDREVYESETTPKESRGNTGYQELDREASAIFLSKLIWIIS